ncbi:ion transporter [Flavobacterium aquatile]|uniref:Ion transporter n=1 Tax=Flavobacterium aquatile LMG 4008 = ATCC 11947 TaxID=1453498 RepID=A0A095UY07_9FLAO|nr:ion transporter [Flavobacterium aquatile]KGD67480.1 ion transporter [Flavobacterium aquatile LMG 4008 = ATCC 11947]OXA67017.1 ion transporter [Flavobacterium aquatile] [Flavobacterium aquatile LMG 4008 = ATCC 11947]GEC79928.1 ion transporter [Flavobacterium aquatile]
MREVKSKFDILRQKIYIIIYGANTFAGRLFDLILLGVILLSVLLVMLESVERLDAQYHDFIIISEWIITIFFTIEYILRIFSNRKPWSYIFSFYGIVDLISILPMYLSFIIPGSRMLSVIRALRLLRLFGILNLVHFTGQESKLKLAIKASRTKIIVFVYFILIVSILLGSIMYVVEGKESGFTSIPTSIYWCIVTLTTVGYGDIAPVTTLGQIIASFIMIMGYGIIAVPTGIVTAEFSNMKNNIKPNDGKKCVSCKSEVVKDASFCHHCGEKIRNA